MAFFTQECLNNIKQKISIVDVVSPYVQLKPSGHYLKGLSPFSHEKTPSFFVDPQRNIFKCFSTGNAGDIFRFLELKEQLTFSESVEWLAERFNIPLEYAYTSQNKVKTQQIPFKKLLYSIYEKAMSFFLQQFWEENTLAQRVRNYWTSERHFQLETAREFSVGFAPVELGSLYNFLIKSGFSREDLAQSALFYRPKTATSKLIARYQGRLILPIKDIQCRTIAFSGRQLPFINLPNDPTKEAKYVNSPETPIFVKGHELFNLDKARQNLNEHSSFFFVEGPLDVIRCWECGLKTTVAPQGTGLTEEQLKLLKRYDTPIIGMFDGDNAGIKAGIRLMNLGIPLEIPIKYHLLAPQEDPDSAFDQHPEKAQEMDKKILSPIQFFIKIYTQAGHTNGNLQRQVLQQVLPIVNKCESAILRFELLKELSQTFGLPQKVLEEELLHQEKKTTLFNGPSVNTSNIKSQNNYAETLEGQLLMFLFHAPEWTESILKTISLDWIETKNASGQLLLKILNEFFENGIEPLDNRDLFHLTDEEKNIWCQLIAEDFPNENLNTQLSTILQQFYRRFLKKMISDIDKELIKSSNISTELLKKLQMDRFSYKKALASVSSSMFLTKQ